MYRDNIYYFFTTSSLQHFWTKKKIDLAQKKVKIIVGDTNVCFLPVIFVKDVYIRFRPKIEYHFWYVELLPLRCGLKEVILQSRKREWRLLMFLLQLQLRIFVLSDLATRSSYCHIISELYCFPVIAWKRLKSSIETNWRLHPCYFCECFNILAGQSCNCLFSGVCLSQIGSVLQIFLKVLVSL